MHTRLPIFATCTCLLLVAAATRSHAQAPQFANPYEQEVVSATNVLAQSMSVSSGIPKKLLAEAQAIAIVPNMVRGAFIIGLQHGRGVLLTRGPGGAWQPPRMIQITGGSIGYQIGVQSTDLVLVFRTPQSVANLMKGTVKIGVDASAAAGPIGRQSSAATDLPLQAEILSYSRARGAFLGVSIDGSSISLDPAADQAYYQPPGTVPASAVQLIQYATAYSGGAAAPTSPPPATPAAPPSASSTPPPGPPSAPPAATVAAMPAVPEAPGKIEAARQQLDAASRQLAASLDDNWKKYLALPPEIYIPYHTPNPQVLQQALSRYEEISRNPKYAVLTGRPDFQATLKAMWRLAELQTDANTPLQLPPPPPR
ncbi:MAG: lipid-binding SYLF domain-containing protein [Pirellulales bacterium]